MYNSVESVFLKIYICCLSIIKFVKFRYKTVSYLDDMFLLGRKIIEQIIMNIKENIDNVCFIDLNFQDGDLNILKVYVYVCCFLMN